MATRQSNPGTTALIMLSIIIVLMLVFQGLLLITTSSIYRIALQDSLANHEFDSAWEAAKDAFFSICGICFLWPILLVYVATAFSISLHGRNIYGKKHALSTIIGFFVGIGGVITGMAGIFFFLVIFGYEVGIPLSLILPVALIAVGLFLFIKDIGGKWIGAIGTGIVCLSQIGLGIGLFFAFSADSMGGAKGGLLLSIFALVIGIIGLVTIAAGFVKSFIWVIKNKPLIDEEQMQQLQMQQHQLNLQIEQLSLQKQQLQLQMQQSDLIADMTKDQIPEQSGINGAPGPQGPPPESNAVERQ